MPTPFWDPWFRPLAAFWYSPRRWAHNGDVQWSDQLEALRKRSLYWAYHRAGVPRIDTDGHANVLRIGRAYSPVAPHVIRALTEDEADDGLSPLLDTRSLRALATGRVVIPSQERPHEIVRLALIRLPDRSYALDDARHWRHVADGMQYCVKRLLVPVRHALERSNFGLKICPCCGRAFPGRGKACPPCRRRWGRRRVQLRLGRAPKRPVVFVTLSKAWGTESVALEFAPGVHSLGSLQCLSTQDPLCPKPEPQLRT